MKRETFECEWCGESWKEEGQIKERRKFYKPGLSHTHCRTDGDLRMSKSSYMSVVSLTSLELAGFLVSATLVQQLLKYVTFLVLRICFNKLSESNHLSLWKKYKLGSKKWSSAQVENICKNVTFGKHQSGFATLSVQVNYPRS